MPSTRATSWEQVPAGRLVQSDRREELLDVVVVPFTISATKSRRTGDYRAHWIALGAIFCYMSIDEFVEIHEWPSALPGLGSFHGFLCYGWMLPAVFVVAAFAPSYLRFLFHLPMSTRVKVSLFPKCVEYGPEPGMGTVTRRSCHKREGP